MSDAQMKRCFAKDPGMVSRKIADEFILVPVRHKAGEVDSIYTVNEVGGRIWEIIDGEKTLSEIRDIIVDEFEIGGEQVEIDLVEFLRQLEEIGAVKAV